MRIPLAGDTIVALSTAPGTGAIAVVRLSGPRAITTADSLFQTSRKEVVLRDAPGHTAHFGKIMDGEEVLDEVVLTLFRAPHSYTGEDVVEISCHGSLYIQQRMLEVMLNRGLRLADPGEFTLRAFRNGKMDLSQAEAVADLIAAQSRAAHDLALKQMRGGYSGRIAGLRRQLVDFTALIELELDFSEEDVNFADRSTLLRTVGELKEAIGALRDSFAMGNVLKRGIPVAIVGKPNVGKSTLLNALLNEEKAIVSEIPGTTRDAIEDTIVIEGIPFRFIDTAGLRETSDRIETLGIERTLDKIGQASIVLCVFDISTTPWEEIEEMHTLCAGALHLEQKKVILVGNKTDLLMETPSHFRDLVEWETVFVSAKRRENIHLLAETLLRAVDRHGLQDGSLVSNSRHFEAFGKAAEALERVDRGLHQEISSDLVTTDLRDALYHLGTITGEVTTDEILESIFSRFCIGK
ncbi:MAG TPA: tRNA uridine-5-carboxymethylaminomethyl(34) synthesis GTPase MnmE [Bacteroidales bacterium]|nr:tRNA uridine-5-carboxymethylaminomethyl(34) synthesis GTPase MnmE [Bacteroidales bacterium]